MKNIIKALENNKLLLQLSKKFYEREAVFAAAHKFTDSCVILIEPIEDEYVGIYFQAKENQSQSDLEKISSNFCNEILDQQVRLNLERRYGNLRDIIVQHAFSPIADLKKAIKAE